MGIHLVPLPCAGPNCRGFDDIADAVKIGMIANADTLHSCVARSCKVGRPDRADPVMIAAGGAPLQPTRHCATSCCLATLLTPEFARGRAFAGVPVAKTRAKKWRNTGRTTLCVWGQRAVLLKGGHLTALIALIAWSQNTTCLRLPAPEIIPANTMALDAHCLPVHCGTLQRVSPADATAAAKAYVVNAIALRAEDLSVGHGPPPYHFATLFQMKNDTHEIHSDPFFNSLRFPPLVRIKSPSVSIGSELIMVLSGRKWYFAEQRDR
jgi:hydroxymethylpyrimidine/phosphomethylpyrimidine kinase